jgi:hypothetical protein
VDCPYAWCLAAADLPPLHALQQLHELRLLHWPSEELDVLTVEDRALFEQRPCAVLPHLEVLEWRTLCPRTQSRVPDISPVHAGFCPPLHSAPLSLWQKSNAAWRGLSGRSFPTLPRQIAAQLLSARGLAQSFYASVCRWSTALRWLCLLLFHLSLAVPLTHIVHSSSKAAVGLSARGWQVSCMCCS